MKSIGAWKDVSWVVSMRRFATLQFQPLRQRKSASALNPDGVGTVAYPPSGSAHVGFDEGLSIR
jgi:hypothetical protein